MLLSAQQLSLSVGSNQLVQGFDASLVDAQRVALVGPNGCGKTTLLRALAAKVTPAATATAARPAPPYFVLGAGSIRGSLVENGDGNIGDQVLFAEQDKLDWMRLLGEGVADSEDELREMTVPEALDVAAALGGDGDGDDDAAATALDDAEEWRRMSVAAQSLNWQVARYDETPIAQLSPGAAVRAFLAIALHRPAVRLLLLDEPTNHLDLPTILWLQHAIIASGKACVFVSHDTEFLDGVAQKLWVIDKLTHTVTVSHATYSAYRRTEELAREQQRHAYEAQQKRHTRLANAAEQLRRASTAGEFSGMKDRDKLQRDFRRDRAGRSGRKAKALDAAREAEEKIEKVVDVAPLHIDLPALGAGTDSSIQLSEVRLGYASDAPLPLSPVSLRIDYGERVALVGFNGVGKSTLLKTLLGNLNALGGEVRIGRDLRVGNLTQLHHDLPRELSARQHIFNLTGEDKLGRLIRYGLTRRQVDVKMAELNPGARARVILATFSFRQTNVLVLDEPTNHLDEEAVDEVLSSLNSYTGTVIVVSHSRAFLRTLDLSRVFVLNESGLEELDSIDEFVAPTDDEARAVVATMFGAG